MLTVILAGIRKDGWLPLWESVDKAYSGEWEIILIGPYKPEGEFAKKENVSYIEDWGTPTRCMQRGLIAAKGEWVTYLWDDGVVMRGAFDRAFEQLEQHGMDWKVAISGKYIEGDTTTENIKLMSGSEYYRINHHHSAYSPYISSDFLLFNTGVVSARLLKEIGGLDCRFEAIAMAFVDLAVRMQFYGAKIVLSDDVMVKCGWMKGESGDHAPMHKAMFENDMSLYEMKYASARCISQCILDVDNWKYKPDRWERRFGPCD